MNVNRILVVDDEPQLRRVLCAILSAVGFTVAGTESGESALAKMRTENFDLILLDINMPGISGLEACRAIRVRSKVGILMLTVRDRPEDKIQALDAGADDYITKPFDIDELLARVRATLRRVTTSAFSEIKVFQLDDLEIRFHDRQVRVGQRTTSLTPKELDLLYYFVTHPNSTLTHKKILQAVWGTDYGSHVEYLRVFVNQLRKKIEIDSTRPRYILTEPWLGYRFNTQGTTKSTPTGQE